MTPSQHARPVRAGPEQQPAHRAQAAVAPPSITGVAWLQRTYGNQAVLQLLARRGAPIQPTPRTIASVQRNGKSAELLKTMGVPQVKPGPTVEVQDQIVAALEKQIAQDLPQPESADEQVQQTYRAALSNKYGVSCVGGIELSESVKGQSVEDLIKGAKLVDLDRGSLYDREGNFALVQKAGVAQQVIVNTLQTMEAAGQLEYLRESELIDKTWKIIIEIHYYRERDISMTAFHKDTTGKTLFVNLNFVAGDPTTEETLLGPEYIVNPDTNEEYEDWLMEAGRLPSAFTQDLKSAKKELGKPTEIGATKVPAKGFVAFVDELIHHKTPTRGQRTATASIVTTALRKEPYKADFTIAEAAYKQYKERKAALSGENSPEAQPGLVSCLPTDWAHEKLVVWERILLAIGDGDGRFDRDQLGVLFPQANFPNRDELIERVIETGGFSDFGKVDLRHAASDIYSEALNVEVKPRNKPPLPRRLSQWLAADKAKGDKEKKEMPQPRPETERRSFFRTWVRAEKRH
jgi:hypothetical protein